MVISCAGRKHVIESERKIIYRFQVTTVMSRSYGGDGELSVAGDRKDLWVSGGGEFKSIAPRLVKKVWFHLLFLSSYIYLFTYLVPLIFTLF